MALASSAKRGMRTRRGAGLLAGQLVAPKGPGRAHRHTRSGPSGRDLCAKGQHHRALWGDVEARGAAAWIPGRWVWFGWGPKWGALRGSPRFGVARFGVFLVRLCSPWRVRAMAVARYAKRGMRTAWGPPLGGRARCHMGPRPGPYADRRHRLFAGDGRRKGQHHRAVWGDVEVRGAARRRATRLGAHASRLVPVGKAWLRCRRKATRRPACPAVQGGRPRRRRCRRLRRARLRARSASAGPAKRPGPRLVAPLTPPGSPAPRPGAAGCACAPGRPPRRGAGAGARPPR